MGDVILFPLKQDNEENSEPEKYEQPLFYAYWEDGKMQFYFQDLNKYDLQEIIYFIDSLLPSN